MTAQEDLELTEAIEELDRTDGLTDEELEAEAIETYGSKAEELDYIIERLSALNRRDYYRFRLALRYHRKALIQQSKSSESSKRRQKMSSIKDYIWEQIEQGKEEQELTLNERNTQTKS